MHLAALFLKQSPSYLALPFLFAKLIKAAHIPIRLCLLHRKTGTFLILKTMPYIGGRLALWKAETLFDGSLANFLYKPEIGLHPQMDV